MSPYSQLKCTYLAFLPYENDVYFFNFSPLLEEKDNKTTTKIKINIFFHMAIYIHFDICQKNKVY